MAHLFLLILKYHSFRGPPVSHHANRKFNFGYFQLIDKSRLIYNSDNVYKVNVKGKINLGWTNYFPIGKSQEVLN